MKKLLALALVSLSIATPAQYPVSVRTTNGTAFNLTVNGGSMSNVIADGIPVGSGASGPQHMNQGAMLYTGAKIANFGRTFNLPGVVGILGFGDNAIPAGTGTSFSGVIHNGMATFMPWVGTLFGCVNGDGALINATGTATFNGGDGTSPIWNGPFYTYANGQATTNTYTVISGITATHLVFNCVQSNGFGSGVIYTNGGGGTYGAFRTISNNNSGSFTAFTTNIWLGGTITNCGAAFVSTGTNITYGQVACGLYSTNGYGYIFDAEFGANGNIEFAMTNSTASNAYRVFIKPYFDAVIISDLNSSNGVYNGAKYFSQMIAPTASATSWRTDMILLSGSPDTNNPATPSTRLAALRAGEDFGIPVFDSYGYFYPDTPSRLWGFVPSGDVHYTNYIGRMIATRFVDWAGWNWGHQMQNGYPLQLTTLPYILKTNGTAWGSFTVHPSNDRLFVVDSVNASITGIRVGQTSGGTSSSLWNFSGGENGETYLNSDNYLRFYDNGFGNPVFSKEPNGSLLFGSIFANQADVGAGNARFNGALITTGIETATNNVASFRSNQVASATIAVGASPFSWTNVQTCNVQVFVDGVSVTGTTAINGGIVFNTIGQNVLPLGPGEWATITYTLGTPTASWRPAR